MKLFRRLLLPLSLAAIVAAVTPLSALAATQPRLGTAASFSVLAGAGITNTNTSTVTGDVGTFPTTTETGFGSLTVGGINHAGDAVSQGAKTDLVVAYNDAAGQTPFTDLTGVNLGGQNLVPGTYRFSSSAQLTGNLTLSGFGVYVFQIGSTLTTASGSSVLLTGGAQACGVYWQVTSSATFGTTTAFQGTVIALTSITMNTGATLIGRALARNGAVTLDTNTITTPAANCAGLPSSGGLPNTGVPSELLSGFSWLLVIGVGSGLAVGVLGISSRRRRRRSA
jgi:hypothetical protein